jgi:hypothetical protein
LSNSVSSFISITQDKKSSDSTYKTLFSITHIFYHIQVIVGEQANFQWDDDEVRFVLEWLCKQGPQCTLCPGSYNAVKTALQSGMRPFITLHSRTGFEYSSNKKMKPTIN